ncbi:polysaccharide biosynthesis protein, partial [Candidatus Poribacteria bacterium]|nr:polysaccharide biosynthesis protein [Candidatus Poribacteria bacterium]
DPAVLREVVQHCQNAKVEFHIIPSMSVITSGRVEVSPVRRVEIEDLLGREPVDLSLSEERNYLRGECVLVTGAGGSIGSELCRQIARCEPSRLVLLGKGENSIHEIYQDLLRAHPRLSVEPVIADVRDEVRIRRVFEKFHPAIVFHAAAHKHVPLMEMQPGEAVKNNVIGTGDVAFLAHECGVKHFLLISSDKAVRPSSVMGATKRLAEFIVFGLAAESQTIFQAVRFGNVLGSRGSVIPIFEKQIAAGGPVTVTHPEVTRYFMTISEAVSLTLQAASMRRSGSLFLLDMGMPVRIVDLARNLISLSGLKPGEDIQLQFTGLRPGEKLREDLLTEAEDAHATGIGKVWVAQPRDVRPWEEVAALVQRLGGMADRGQDSDVVELIQKLIPDFHPYSRPELSDAEALSAVSRRASDALDASVERARRELELDARLRPGAENETPAGDACELVESPTEGQQELFEEEPGDDTLETGEYHAPEVKSRELRREPDLLDLLEEGGEPRDAAPEAPAHPLIVSGHVPDEQLRASGDWIATDMESESGQAEESEIQPPPQPFKTPTLIDHHHLTPLPIPQASLASMGGEGIATDANGQFQSVELRKPNFDADYTPAPREGFAEDVPPETEAADRGGTPIPIRATGFLIPPGATPLPLPPRMLNELGGANWTPVPADDLLDEQSTPGLPSQQAEDDKSGEAETQPGLEPQTGRHQVSYFVPLQEIPGDRHAALVEHLAEMIGHEDRLILQPAGPAPPIPERVRARTTVLAENLEPGPKSWNAALEACPRFSLLAAVRGDIRLKGDLSEALGIALRRDEDAVVLYSDYDEATSGGSKRVESFDHLGCPHERFEFGPLMVFGADIVKMAGGFREDLKYAWEYDMLLKLMQEGLFVRIPSPLYEFFPPPKEEARGGLHSPGKGPLGGFSYVFYPEEVEREVTAVFEKALRDVGAWIEVEPALVPPPPRLCEVTASVVIPVLNREKYIAHAIDSVLNGTFKDFEIVVVDNGSTDWTYQIVKEYTESDPRVRLVEGGGGTIASALNTGIRLARGEYICQLDSDDEYVPETLDHMIAYLRAHPRCGLAISFYCLMDEEGRVLEDLPPVTHSGYNCNQILRRDGAGALRVFPKTVLEEFGLYDEKHYGNFGEDYDMVLKVSEKYEVGRVQEVLYHYRRHEENTDVTRDPVMKHLNKNRARQQALHRRMKLNE